MRRVCKSAWFHVVLLAMVVGAASCMGPSEEALLGSARKYLDQNDPAAAILQLKTLLQEKPESASGRFLLGKALLGSGDPAGAEAELRRALEHGHPQQAVIPALATAMVEQQKYAQVLQDYGQTELSDGLGAAELLTQLAQAHAAGGQDDPARSAIDQALKRAPTFVPALVMKARLLGSGGELPAATSLADALAAKHPQDADVWLLKGDLLRAGKGPAAEVTAAYQKAVTLRPQSVPAQVGVMSLLIEQGQLDAADKQLTEMKKVLPRHPATQVHEAALALLRGDAHRTRAIAQGLLRGAPDNARLLVLAGQAELALGSLAQAETLLTRAVQVSPTAVQPRLGLAQAQLRRGQPGRALDVLQGLVAGPAASADALALAGQAHLMRGEFKKADASFARAAAIRPGDASVRTSQAMSLLAQGQADRGIAELQSAAQDTAGTTADMALIAAHLRRSDFNAALKAADGLAGKRPGSALPDHLRGQIALQQRDVATARRSFEAALAMDGRYAPAAIGLSELDLADKKPEAARSRLDALLKADPDSVPGLMATAELTRRTGGTPDDVADLLARAVRAGPFDPRAQRALIDHHLNAGDGARALTAAQAASALMPAEPDLLERLGLAQLMVGEPNQAIASFNKLAAMQPKSALAQLRLADAYLAANSADKAAEHARRALDLSPDWLPAQRAGIVLAMREGQPAQAIAIARKVQARHSDEAIGFRLEGDIEANLKHWDAAASAFRKALAKAGAGDAPARLHLALMSGRKDAEAAQFGQAWLKDHPGDVAFRRHLGEAAMLRSDWEAAEQHFRQVLEIQPDDSSSLNNLAYLLLKFKKAGALPLAERAAQNAPTNPAILDTLALARAEAQQMDKAIEAQARAVALAPDNGGLRLNLAKLYVQTGDKERARGQLERLTKLGASFSAHAEVEQLVKELGPGPIVDATHATRPSPTAPAPAIGRRDVAVIAGFAAALGLSVILLIAAWRPPVFQVERSIVVESPAQRVFDLLQDLRLWESWSTLKPLDPSMTRSFTGSPAGIGAVCRWHDASKRAEGLLEVMHSAAPSTLVVEAMDTRPSERRQLYEFALTASDPRTTEVRWVARGPATYAMRVAGVVTGFDRRIGKALAADLSRLKAAAEGALAKQPGLGNTGSPAAA